MAPAAQYKEKPSQPGFARGKTGKPPFGRGESAPPLVAGTTTFAPVGSVSLDSQSSADSLQHGYHRLTGFSGRSRSLTNPVRWCDSSTLATPVQGALWVLGIVPHVPIGKHRAVYSSLNRSGVMASSHSPVNLKNFPQQKSRPAGQLFIHVIILQPEPLRGKELLPKRRRFFCGLHRC